MSIQEKTNAIIDFLRPRLEDGLLLFAYQTEGKIDLKGVREKAEKELLLLERSKEMGDDLECLCGQAAKNIAFYIDMSLDVAFLSNSKQRQTFFLPSFLSFVPELTKKIQEIVNN